MIIDGFEEEEVFIHILFTIQDVRDMAESNNIPIEDAIDRASDWGRHIQETMSGYCWEQLEEAVKTGQV